MYHTHTFLIRARDLSPLPQGTRRRNKISRAYKRRLIGASRVDANAIRAKEQNSHPCSRMRVCISRRFARNTLDLSIYQAIRHSPPPSFYQMTVRCQAFCVVPVCTGKFADETQVSKW